MHDVWPQLTDQDDLLNACHEVSELIWKNRAHAVTGSVDIALWGTTVRARKATYAVCTLCVHGFGEQAGMLCRSLFEDMAVAWWIRQADPQHVQELFDASELRFRAERERDLIKHGHVGAETRGLLDEERRAKILKPHLPPLWVGKGVYDILKEVESAWPKEERPLLWEIHDLTHGGHNWILHDTPLAMELTMGAQRFFAARSNQYVAEALRAALYSIGHIGRAVLEGEALGALDQRLSELRPVLFPLTSDQRKGIGPNDPCPCGSGRKYKACHGA